MELVSEGQRLPRRTVGQRRVRWVRASYGAGATRRTLVRSCMAAAAPRSGLTPRGRCAAGRCRCRWSAGLSASPITIRAMCPGMGTWPAASGRERTRSAAAREAAPREGTALLQGPVRCGRCGRRMSHRRIAPWYPAQADRQLHRHARCAPPRADPRQRLLTSTPSDPLTQMRDTVRSCNVAFLLFYSPLQQVERRPDDRLRVDPVMAVQVLHVPGLAEVANAQRGDRRAVDRRQERQRVGVAVEHAHHRRRAP